MNKLFTFIIFLMFSQAILAQGKIIIHQTTSANVIDFKTTLDHPSLNNNPNAIIFPSHCNTCLNSNKQNVKNNGVYYSESSQQWIIYNTDQSDMEIGLTFFVYIVNDPTYGMVRLCQSNSNYFNISHNTINNIEDKMIAAIHLSKGEVFEPQIGVTYDYDNNRHQVFTENQEEFLELTTNVMVIFDGQEGVTAYRHISRAENTNHYLTYLDHPLLNNKPNARLVITHYKLNHESPYYQYYDKPITAYYSYVQNKWAISSEDYSPIPLDLIFNVFVDETNYMDTNEIEANNQLKLAPNPTKGFVQIETKEFIENIIVYDLTGKKVFENSLPNTQKTQLNLEHLPKGTYLLSIKTQQKTYSEKLIIQ